MRCRCKIAFHGKPLVVEFTPQAPDYSVGLVGWGSEEHALFDPETEDPLAALEAGMTDGDWEEIADLVNATFDFNIDACSGLEDEP